MEETKTNLKTLQEKEKEFNKISKEVANAESESDYIIAKYKFDKLAIEISDLKREIRN